VMVAVSEWCDDGEIAHKEGIRGCRGLMSKARRATMDCTRGCSPNLLPAGIKEMGRWRLLMRGASACRPDQGTVDA